MKLVDTEYRCRRVQALLLTQLQRLLGVVWLQVSGSRLLRSHQLLLQLLGLRVVPACAEPCPVRGGSDPSLLQLPGARGAALAAQGSAAAVWIHTSLRSLPGDVMLVLQEHMLSIFCRVTVFFLVFIRIYLT